MGAPRKRRRESTAGRRERHAAVGDVGQVVDAAARLLETRPRSIAEVRRRLTSSGYQPGLVEAAVSRLAELGYLDDEAFARTWVESRDRAHPRGERALRSELLAKGIDRAVIEVILADRGAASRTTEDAAALRLLERHRRALFREPDPARRRQKAYALLARNGFDPETARVAAGSFTAGAPEDPGEEDPGG